MTDKKNTLTKFSLKSLQTIMLVLFSMSLCTADEGVYQKKHKKHGDHRPRFTSGDTVQDPGTGATFIYVSAGCFMMGCDDARQKCANDELPRHKVCLDGFWIGRYEVTQALWQKIMGHNPSRYTGNEALPVETVSFNDIKKFIRRLNTSPRRFYSLPTEAQWEYACQKRPDGMQAAARIDEPGRIPDANCATCGNGGEPGIGPRRTTPVGSYAPNFLGLYDMLGNVKEWCADFYDKKAYNTPSQKNPVVQKKSAARVIRGGSFLDNDSRVSCHGRDKSIPALKSSATGFRLIMVSPDLHE